MKFKPRTNFVYKIHTCSHTPTTVSNMQRIFLVTLKVVVVVSLPLSEFSRTRYRVLESDWVAVFPLHLWYIPSLFATGVRNFGGIWLSLGITVWNCVWYKYFCESEKKESPFIIIIKFQTSQVTRLLRVGPTISMTDPLTRSHTKPALYSRPGH